MSRTQCTCTPGKRLTGSGCRYCQPQAYIDRLHEQLEEVSEVQTDNNALADCWRLLRADFVEFGIINDDCPNFLIGEKVFEYIRQFTDTLTNPEAVLVNMMRGTIAAPSVAGWSKLYGDVINDGDLQLMEIARLREAQKTCPYCANRACIQRKIDEQEG